MTMALRLAVVAAALVCLGAARAHPMPDADFAPFDYYLLSLSWSPAYCAAHPGERAECGQHRGFVVHGLWPQYINGGGPEHCASEGPPDPVTIERTLSAMPDEHLIHHEWEVHGTCSGLSAHDYFVSLIRAVGSLSFPPDFDGQATRRLSAAQIVEQFERANAGLTAASIAVRCKGDRFEELRICLSPDLHPVPCGRGVHSQCRQGPLVLRAAR